ncbi:putative dipeptidyl-aminopeptidase B [Smittium mucronatum]|uniref:Putative dipeptidyl-aminopeptidase B n=1 Tax=Smittium mucronatum TaxID=133383 RepID=A0A1R0H371_9FUNG|nr:putative dipeptidyl-aminopeptidase B [Smittium mucronatum]
MGATDTGSSPKYISFDEYNKGVFASVLDDIDYLKHPSNSSLDGLYLSAESGYKVVSVDGTFSQILAESSEIEHALEQTGLPTDTDFISSLVSPDFKYILFETGREKIFRHSYYSTYYIYDVQGASMAPLSDRLNDKVTLAQFAPVGHTISFVIENDLYVSDMSTINRVTTSGGVNVFNAISDWVYEEEVFASSSSHWWSPDGTKIIFLQANDTLVPEFKYSLYHPYDANNSYPEEQAIKFPKAGYPNPVPRLYMYDLNSVEKSGPQPIDLLDEEYIVTRVSWMTSTSSDVLIRVANRIQNTFWTFIASEVDGSGFVVKQTRTDSSVDTDNAWIEITNSLVYVPENNTGTGSDGYLDLVERDGFMHIGLFSPLDSSNPIMITSGNWEVIDGSLAYDPLSNIIYYRATTRASYAADIYSINMNGNKTAQMINPKKNLPEEVSGQGSYDFSLSSSGKYGTVTYLGPDVPWRAVYELDLGQIDVSPPVLDLGTNQELRQRLSGMEIPTTKIITVPSEPGYADLDVRFLFPPGFDPSLKGHYSLLINYYGGPNSKEVTENYILSSWNAAAVSASANMTEHANASPLVVASIDPRGTAYKGRKFSRIVDRQLGVVEARDVAKATQYLLDQYSYLNADNVGSWGWSYGGFLTLKILETAALSPFKIGMSVAPVTDWKFYDTVYTERYMSTPELNPDGYALSAVHNFTQISAANLLLMHGTGDDNVHIQNSFVLLSKLQDNDDDNLTVMVYPDSDHSIRLTLKNSLYAASSSRALLGAGSAVPQYLGKLQASLYTTKPTEPATPNINNEPAVPPPNSTPEPAKGSFISRLIFGQGQSDDFKDVKSKLRAREKYEHEFVVHKIKAGGLVRYKELISELYPKLAQEYYPRMKLTGSWSTIVGDLDTVYHIWEYSGYDQMESIWCEKTKDPKVAAIEAEIVSLLVGRSNQLVQEFEFCPTSPPITTGGIYELRSYNLHPGKLLEWQGKWFHSLSTRSNLSSLKGAWYSKEGALNQVHHLWVYE